MSILNTFVRRMLDQPSARSDGDNTITPEYAALNAKLHAERPEYGTSGQHWAPLVKSLAGQINAESILDYGCGKQTLAASLPELKIIGYDPAVPGLDQRPQPADLVVCTDVLEHVEPEYISNVLDELKRVTRKLAFVTVATRPAVKTLADGRNAHLTVQPFAWWERHFASRFDIHKVQEAEGHEFSLIMSALEFDHEPISEPSSPAVLNKNIDQVTRTVKHQGKSLLFNTPNRMATWRVDTLFTKEPDTIQWLESMAPGTTMLDIGANVGMYSIFAAKVRNVKVFSFEPESQNFAILNANIALNELSGDVTAYPVALSDKMQFDKLYLSEFSTAASCHSFGEQVGFDLKPRTSKFEQGAIAMALDELVSSGALPVPDYIKIDVDGIEHKIIQGALKTLQNPKVKEILVELNTALVEHRETVERLQSLGFSYDEAQVNGSLRKKGAFKGVGEFIFKRGHAAILNPFTKELHIAPPASRETRKILSHVLRRIDATPIATAPFPYIVVDEVFPADYYKAMLDNFPKMSVMRPIGETGRVPANAYQERNVVLFNDVDFQRLDPAQRRFWLELSQWLYSEQFISILLQKFIHQVDDRLDTILNADPCLHIKGDALLVNDCTNYAIGPHTDSPHRLITFLFYLPPDESDRDLGTSLYTPKEDGFVCWGGPHHLRDRFDLAKTVEFLPNRLLAFPKTEHSFHGVEQIQKENIQRQLLISNIRLTNKVTH